jgi:NADPH:quinone reductase-like Zn-dependent oxidoreductase
MGMLPGAFGPLTVVDQRLIGHVPDGWSFASAAAAPIAFLTAYYALVDLAQCRRGERMLVHAGAGGVGMAAIQLARDLGMEVFATASPSKWGALRALGLDDAHLASSRTLEFRDMFLDATGGEGMDVVLDSLAREFVDASLELMPGGGRFVEMGKTDLRDPREIARAHPGVVYRAFELIEAGADRIQEMLAEIFGLFAQGVLEMLPVTTWDICRAPEAFRYVSQARHVGKNVLMLPASIEPDGTVLVTGGTGRLGGLVAKHLVFEHGVRSVLLAGRQGPQAEGAQELEAELVAGGARVSVVACDVSDREELQGLLDLVPPEHPLTGVVHAAGALADGVIGSLSSEQLAQALVPKVDAAWHLHELTEHLDLGMFMLFSSVAGVLGGPGQANYAAANAFLDGLAAYRRTRGLAATSMAWGRWADSSAMTGHLADADLARLRRIGMGALSSEEGLELFDAGAQTGHALVIPVALDTVAMRSLAKTGALPPSLQGLVRVPARRARIGGSLAARLSETAEEEHERVVLEIVRSEAAMVLGHSSPELVEPRLAFKDLGFDSLTAVELRNRLSGLAELQLPATLVFDYPTPIELAGHLLAKVGDAPAPAQSAAVRVVRGLDEPVAIVGMSCRYPGGVD